MSGHSHSATIKHQKEATDKKRGAAFSKLAKAISIAARSGVDPSTNFKLRLSIERAKQINMPKSNIERAIARGGGDTGEAVLEEISYEGYGPFKVAIIVEVVTDNKNRTLAEVKNIIEKGGGLLAGPGAVAYLFENTGELLINKPTNVEEAILKIMDLGVENVEEFGELIKVDTRPENLEAVAKQLESAKFIIKDKDLIKKPKTLIKIDSPQQKERIVKFIASLEEHDDVQKVFANFDFSI